MPSRGYNSSARMSPAPGAQIHQVFSTDFGQAIPGTFTASDVGSGGSLNATGYLKISWVTAAGESLPSAEVTRTVSGGPSGSISIAQPTVPTNGATVVGWRLYAGTVSGTNYLATTTAQVTQAQTNFTTNAGVIAAFPVATTPLVLKVYPTSGSIPKVVDTSGNQQPLPAIVANSTSDYNFIIPNSCNQWRVQKLTDFMTPSAVTQTSGIALTGVYCSSPLYPSGGSQSVTQGTSSYFVMNGYLFWATASGTTAATFIGLSAFNITPGGTTTDGTVTWTCIGKAVLVLGHFANVSSSTATPVAQQYDIFQQ